ncbi:hypothetical protein [Aneurinibacillus tyrosinisolvens]|jgi:hypothetical protein|uniref:hypothetical protein n=1 Tax=Aneurinibacillus tyrosinisolvens TaxID=1443435 RepID=UPI00063F4C33|nr:hypothetical protein [Aneurinibacillus tyrosinisolvens]
MDKKEKLEQEIAQILTEGEIEREDPQEAARKRLPHKQEVRIQTQTDPIVEETKKFRELAEEVDDRYDKYS